ncbi:hypothetical protein OEZ86_002989 [Tetradesmus obliquus]|nr:hypothetical protein OEZ86_002989 [Tetradesmus obliquus]
MKAYLPAARRQYAGVVWAGKRQQNEPPPGKQQQPTEPAANALDEDEKEEDEYGQGDEEWEDIEEGEFEEGEDEDDEEEEEEEEEEPVSKVAKIPGGQTSIQFTPDDFVEVGVISRAHGIRGEVKVQLTTDEPRKRLGTPNRRLWLQAGTGRGTGAAAGSSSSSQMLQRLIVESGRVARPASKDRRAEWAVKFREVANRDQAELLAGSKLLLALCDRESSPRGRDEFFITDLVGLKALQQGSAELLGIVTEVYDSTSSYSLLRVRLAPDESDIQQSRYRSILVPFVEDMVPTVDVAAGQLLLSLPEGLMETASAKKLRRPYTPEQQAQLRRQLLQRQQQQQEQQ